MSQDVRTAMRPPRSTSSLQRVFVGERLEDLVDRRLQALELLVLLGGLALVHEGESKFVGKRLAQV